MSLLPKKELIYWYREFRHLQSGWTTEQQVQFHEYCLSQLRSSQILSPRPPLLEGEREGDKKEKEKEKEETYLKSNKICCRNIQPKS